MLSCPSTRRRRTYEPAVNPGKVKDRDVRGLLLAAPGVPATIWLPTTRATVCSATTGGEQGRLMVTDPRASFPVSGCPLVVTGTRASGRALLASVPPSPMSTRAVTATLPAGRGEAAGSWKVAAPSGVTEAGSS